MAEHFFLYPFGVSGTRTAVPNPTQVSGTVSYQEGFPIGYEEPNTDPGYLPIPRDQFNQLMNDITAAIQQVQVTGFPSWITSAANGGSSFLYPLGAEVWYQGVPYRSLIVNNTDTPPSANWAVIGQNRSLYFNYAVDTGVADHYVTAPNPAIAAYAEGQVVELKPTFGNTGACDINVNGLGIVPIKTLQNQDPPANTIIPAGIYTLVYNATTVAWVVQNPSLGTASFANTGLGAGQVPLNSQLGSAAYAGLGSLLDEAQQVIFTTGATTGSFTIGPYTIQFGKGTSDWRWQQTFNTFPIAFSAKPLYVNFVPELSVSPPAFSSGIQTTPNVSGVTKFGFYAQNQNNGANEPCFYLAIGLT